MNKIFIIALICVLAGCGGSGGSGSAPPSAEVPIDERPTEPFDPDVEYPDATPPDMGIVVPIPPKVEPCVEVSWIAPTERVNGAVLDPSEIGFILVIRDPSAGDDVNVWQNIYDRGTIEERMLAGDPLITYVDYSVTSVDTCVDIGLERGDVWYWFGVVAVDTDGNYSDASELVYPRFLEED